MNIWGRSDSLKWNSTAKSLRQECVWRGGWCGWNRVNKGEGQEISLEK